MATSYSNPGGTGKRDYVIAATVANLVYANNPNDMVDGVTNNAGFCLYGDTLTGTNQTIQFALPTKALITEARVIQSGNGQTGTWKWQGSNNGTDWSDIGASFTWPTDNTFTITTLSENATSYLYYRILGLSGRSSSGWVFEFEFKIDGTSATTSEASYFNTLSIGDRTSSITVTSNCVDYKSPNYLVNGDGTNAGWFNGQTTVGKYIKFDFGVDITLTEAKFFQSGGGAQGTWKWQGSSDNSNWVDIGSSFSFVASGSFDTLTQLNGNTTQYRYYQMVGVSGSSNSGPFCQEFVFKYSTTPPTDSGTGATTIAVITAAAQAVQGTAGTGASSIEKITVLAGAAHGTAVAFTATVQRVTGVGRGTHQAPKGSSTGLGINLQRSWD